MPNLLGFQIVHSETDEPPPGMKTYEVYPLAEVLGFFAKLPAVEKPNWRMVPIFKGDVDEPTFPKGNHIRQDMLCLLEHLLSLTEPSTPGMDPGDRREWQRISSTVADMRLTADGGDLEDM